jgi:hypothetical protein
MAELKEKENELVSYAKPPFFIPTPRGNSQGSYQTSPETPIPTGVNSVYLE